ncbi:MAG: hypothetical protein ACPGD8_05570 [Flavobacteriales bacterium]
MNRLLFILCALVVTACQTDPLLPCNADGPVGKVCREYRYANGSGVGFVEYEYEGESVITTNIFNQQSNPVKTVVQRFENGQTTVIAEQYPDQPSNVQTWHYDEMDSLFLVYHGFNDSTLEITYEQGRRIREDYFNTDSLDRWVAYRYYQDNGKLYRKSFHNNQNLLLYYEIYDYFSTGQDRISYFDPNNQLIGRRVFRFSQLGLVTSMQYTLANGQITEHADYIYDAAGKLTEQTLTVAQRATKSVYLYY